MFKTDDLQKQLPPLFDVLVHVTTYLYVPSTYMYHAMHCIAVGVHVHVHVHAHVTSSGSRARERNLFKTCQTGLG